MGAVRVALVPIPLSCFFSHPIPVLLAPQSYCSKINGWSRREEISPPPPPPPPMALIARNEQKLFPLALFVLSTLLSQASHGIETPQFTVVHSESDFEIRLYSTSSWMSAPTDDVSFYRATKRGFHRLFQYIQGANLNSLRIRMTAPVLTSIVPDAGPLGSSAYHVRFYLPTEFQASPPLPLPELKLYPVRWPSHCIAVRQFPGFARDNNVVKEVEKLAISLSKSPWANSTGFAKNAYSIAQYNAPFRFIGRVNEIWVDVSGSEAQGCGSGWLASY